MTSVLATREGGRAVGFGPVHRLESLGAPVLVSPENAEQETRRADGKAQKGNSRIDGSPVTSMPVDQPQKDDQQDGQEWFC
jgi:hypothetical protein